MKYLDTVVQDLSESHRRDALALLLTPSEAAQALRIGRSKVYELMRIGAQRSLKIGGCRRITTEALHEFVESLQAAS